MLRFVAQPGDHRAYRFEINADTEINFSELMQKSGAQRVVAGKEGLQRVNLVAAGRLNLGYYAHEGQGVRVGAMLTELDYRSPLTSMSCPAVACALLKNCGRSLRASKI